MMTSRLKAKMSVAARLGDLAARRTLLAATNRARVAVVTGAPANLGDAACYLALRRLVPGVELVPLSEPGLELRARRVGLSGPRYFGGLVIGGGTLIHPAFEELVRVVWSPGMPTWLCGTGVGSCGLAQDESVDVSGMRHILSQCRGLGVRGPVSKSVLDGMGIGGVEVIGDLALSLTSEEGARSTSRRTVAVNLIDLGGDAVRASEGQMVEGLEKALRTLARSGWQVVGLALYPTDVQPTERLLRRVVPGAPVRLVQSPDSFFETVDRCAFVVGVRLHAAVLAACRGVPSLALAYRPKHLDFMESVGLARWHLPLHGMTSARVREDVLALAEEHASVGGPLLGTAMSFKRRQAEFVRRVRVAAA